MVASSKEPIGLKVPFYEGLTKPAALVVALGCLGASLPLMMPQLAQSDYSASTQLQMTMAQPMSAAEWGEFHQYLERQIKSESALSRLLSSAKPSPASIGVSFEPSISELIGELLSDDTAKRPTREEEMRSALSQRISLSLPQANGQPITLSVRAKQAEVAKQLLDHLSLNAQAQIGRYQQSPADLELASARDALEKVESQLTGFQMRFGSERIAQMLQVVEDFNASKRSVEALRQEQYSLTRALETVKRIKPAQALHEALPDGSGFDALRDLQQAYANAKSVLTGLGSDYGPKHPKLLAAQGNIDQISAAAAKALRQSRSEIEQSDKAVHADLSVAEQKLAQLNERMAEHGNAPEELVSLEKRLEAARQHYLSLAALSASPEATLALSADIIASQSRIVPLTNHMLLALYSLLTAVGFACAGAFVSMRRNWGSKAATSEKPPLVPREPPLSQSNNSNTPKRMTIEAVQKERGLPPVQAPAAPLEHPQTDADYMQDNELPFDLKVKSLLMRHAVSDQERTLTHLPPLVEAAVRGQLTLTEGERRELSAIQSELADLRQALKFK